MAELIVADASVLIGLLDGRSAHHVEAIDVLASVERFVVHPLTLADVLVHPARRGHADEVVARLEAIGMMVSSRPLEPVGLAKLRATTGLKMPDCVVLACAHAHRLGIATFEMALRSVADEGSNAAP